VGRESEKVDGTEGSTISDRITWNKPSLPPSPPPKKKMAKSSEEKTAAFFILDFFLGGGAGGGGLSVPFKMSEIVASSLVIFRSPAPFPFTPATHVALTELTAICVHSVN